MLTVFLLPEGFLASTTGMLKVLATDLKPLIVLALGLALAFYVINKLMGLLIGTLGKR